MHLLHYTYIHICCDKAGLVAVIITIVESSSLFYSFTSCKFYLILVTLYYLYSLHLTICTHYIVLFVLVTLYYLYSLHCTICTRYIVLFVLVTLYYFVLVTLYYLVLVTLYYLYSLHCKDCISRKS